ncbi:TIGR02391 family protein [Lentzea sp. NBRC 102530]|uniref:TIGR02391 family protein n=1 Tax=Lentzea sp. NBRC 102530 TaxID=3032201 RepID=UPI0024A58790|nr:TIGR02391 family protein [Lentzea sp. NBRC 102530]GLY53584.1 hypothetical protein Lesp01_72400 [Lentzea sp. NBRC 102530]
MIGLRPAEALALPIDELAMLVLEDIVRSNHWNEWNVLNSYVNDSAGLGYGNDPEARKAIAEAMGWLRSQGMIARSPEQTADAAIIVTRWGGEALKKSVAEVLAVNRIQSNLHPQLEQKVRRQFLLGEYEMAIFVAMKAIEVRVRHLAGYGNEVIGGDLMIKAFKSGGPLADPVAPPGEVEDTMMLFKGAYSVLRNPSGHREVSFDDVTEAAEAVMTASMLMRMLDRVEARLAGNSP